MPTAQSSSAVRFHVYWGWAIASTLVVLSVSGCARTMAQPKDAPPPPSVTYTLPAKDLVTEYEEFTGRTAASNVVEVRSRVSGYLQERLFRDGDTVKKGELLFQIDPRPFAAEVARAAANIDQYEARSQRLELQTSRAKQLIDKQAISQDDFETIQFDGNEARATLKAAIAARDAAQLNLDFTKVTAPISGRISRRLVDVGNLVKADDTLLVTIVASDPLYVYFDVDERTLLRLRRLAKDGKIVPLKKDWDKENASDENHVAGTPILVNYALADEDGYPDDNPPAQVTFEDNQVDPATGTLRFRAVIDNEKGLLSPGLFMRLRFPIGEAHEALLIPESVLISDQGKRSVYVIGEDNTIKSRDVTVGVLDPKGRREILAGLKYGDRVVSKDLQRVPLGKPVNPVNENEPAKSDKTDQTKPAE